MSDDALILDDDYIEEIGLYCKKRAYILEKIFSKYIRILETSKNEAIKSGEISDALDSYIKCVKLLENKLFQLSNDVANIGRNFILEIDETDSYLF